MKCLNCGQEIPDNVKFCPRCGFKMQAPQAPVNQAAPVPPVQPGAPVRQAAPQQAQVPPRNGVQPPNGTQPRAGAQPPSGTQPPKKKKKWWLFLIIGIAALLLLAAAAVALLFYLRGKARDERYQQGVTKLRRGEYTEAEQIFAELGDYKDAPKRRLDAEMYLKYEAVDALLDQEDYEQAVKELREVSEYFNDDETGLKAAAEAESCEAVIEEKRRIEEERRKREEQLAAEAEAIEDARQLMADGEYDEALSLLEGLELRKEEVGKETCGCMAHIAAENEQWVDMMAYLFAELREDPERNFLNDPQDDLDAVAGEAWYGNDYFTLEEVYDELAAAAGVQAEGAEELKDAAHKSFIYTDAVELYNDGNLEEAIELFSSLGDYKDADAYIEKAEEQLSELADTYSEADALFAKGEFYKALKIFRKLGDYGDAASRADACEQPLPGTGALKTENGSGTVLTIVSPNNGDSVFLKIYNASGTAVCSIFIRGGESGTLNMAPGTYTMRVAYGTEWYGSVDLFGEEGSYQQLMNGSAPEFSLASGYTYTLTLLASTDGNVGSKSIGGAEGM